MADTATPSPRSGLARWLWAIGTVALVAAAGLATWRVTRSDVRGAADAQASAATLPARLTAGHDYYLHIKLIELTERTPNDKAWDSVGDSGPDICFNLTWRKNGIWESEKRPDTLIGSWDLLKVDVKQIVTSGGQMDLEGLLNAPLVHYQPGEQIEMVVWDADTLSSDNAGTIAIKLDELSPGENTLLLETGKTMAVKRVVLSLIDRRTPLPELVDTVSKR